MGMPYAYDDSYIDKAINYIENYADTGDVVPTMAGLSLELGISRSTLYLWMDAEKHPDFAEAVSPLLAKQERLLVNGSLANTLNPAISKLMLNNHGYSDKQEVKKEIKGDIGLKWTVEVVE